MIRIDRRDISGDPAQSEQIRQAHDCLVRNGCAILDHAIPGDRMAAPNDEFGAHYARSQRHREFDDTTAFGDPTIFANPAVVARVRAALAESAILEAYGAIVSLAGAARQHTHRDGPLLFAHVDPSLAS